MPGIVQFGPEILWFWWVRLLRSFTQPLKLLRWLVRVFIAICEVLLGGVFTDVEDIISVN